MYLCPTLSSPPSQVRHAKLSYCSYHDDIAVWWSWLEACGGIQPISWQTLIYPQQAY